MKKKEKDVNEKFLKDTLNDRLSDLIAEKKKQGISQRTQADNINIDVSSLSNYANGKQLPTAEILFKIAKYYNCSMDYLLGINNIRNIDCEEIAISKKLGLSEKSIEKLKKYHEDYFFKDFQYMQLINFLIENLTYDDLKIFDRFLFSKDKNFEMWNKEECHQSKSISICSNLGKYKVKIQDIQKILLLDIQEIFINLKKLVNEDTRKRNLFELEMEEN